MTLALAAGLGACAPSRPHYGLSFQDRSCRAFDEIDVARLDLSTVDLAMQTDDADEDRTLLGVNGAPPSDAAGDVVHVSRYSSLSGAIALYSAFRLNDGTWVIRWASQSKDEAAIQGERWLALAELDRLLATPCLFDEPAYVPRTIPMRGGGETTCMDGADTLTEIALGGRKRVSLQTCHALGLTGAIANTIDMAARAP